MYIATLVSKEVAKYIGQGNIDYSDSMIDVFLDMFDELRGIDSINYKETIGTRRRSPKITQSIWYTIIHFTTHIYEELLGGEMN